MNLIECHDRRAPPPLSARRAACPRRLLTGPGLLRIPLGIELSRNALRLGARDHREAFQ